MLKEWMAEWQKSSLLSTQEFCLGVYAWTCGCCSDRAGMTNIGKVTTVSMGCMSTPGLCSLNDSGTTSTSTFGAG